MAAQSVPPKSRADGHRFRCHRRPMAPGTTTIDRYDEDVTVTSPQSAAGPVSEVRGLSPANYASTACPDEDMSKMDISRRISSRC